MASLLAFGPSRPALDLPRAGGILISPELSGLRSAVLAVQALVPPGAPIFVGNTRHDRIFVNDVMLYFLAERPSATRFTSCIRAWRPARTSSSGSPPSSRHHAGANRPDYHPKRDHVPLTHWRTRS